MKKFSEIVSKTHFHDFKEYGCSGLLLSCSIDRKSIVYASSGFFSVMIDRGSGKALTTIDSDIDKWWEQESAFIESRMLLSATMLFEMKKEKKLRSL